MQTNPKDYDYKKAVKELNDKAMQRKAYLKGLALGLFYGIIGNMLVSHYYAVFNGFVIAQLDTLFYANLLAFVIILIAILYVTLKWVRSMFRVDAYFEFVEMVKKKYKLDDDFNEKKQ
jgi:H+/Cl- antiporter ClcA